MRVAQQTESTPLSRVQDHCARVATGTIEKGIRLELLEDVKVLESRAYEARRLGFENVTLSPYLESLLRLENSKELIHAG